jgi:glutathionylspermidine synthase
MNDIEKTLADMEAYVEMHAKGWGSKDSAQDYQSKHALCWSATQHIPRLIAAVRELHEAFGNAMEYNAKGDTFNTRFALHIGRRKAADALTGNSETTGMESER